MMHRGCLRVFCERFKLSQHFPTAADLNVKCALCLRVLSHAREEEVRVLDEHGRHVLLEIASREHVRRNYNATAHVKTTRVNEPQNATMQFASRRHWMCGYRTFSLLLPLFSIDVEDSVSQEHAHGVPEPSSLLVLPERGFEHVLDQSGVGSDVDEGRRAKHARRPGHAVAQLVRHVHLRGGSNRKRHTTTMSAHHSSVATTGTQAHACVLLRLCEL